jgi:aspartate/methionine/tyrosine aminotransferase
VLRRSLHSLPASRIREVSQTVDPQADVVRFWFGEGDSPTADFIRAAAKEALDRGETFYGPNLGLPELREAIAAYASRVRAPAAVAVDRIAVTSSGVNALTLVAQALLEPGDRVAIVTPVWPNMTSIPLLYNAEVARVPLEYRGEAWTLDLQRLIDAASPPTKMVIVNSPHNPTGWVMPGRQWDALLGHCRRHGTWLVADDAYERLVYDGSAHAPGLLASVDPDERWISVNTFSKTWSMTGWRLGWVVGPRRFIEDFAKVVEFNTSCAPAFIQRAGVAALAAGEEPVRAGVARLARARDLLLRRLRAMPGVEAATPSGAMYAFLRIPGRSDDSFEFARTLAARGGVGLAPGVAFGPEGEGWLRWCFAAGEELIDEGARRLERFLAAGARA